MEILAYAPMEFYHCQHCEIVWDSVGFGRRIRAEQRTSAVPEDLQAAREDFPLSYWTAANVSSVLIVND